MRRLRFRSQNPVHREGQFKRALLGNFCQAPKNIDQILVAIFHLGIFRLGDGENEIVRFVQCRENFIPCDSHGEGTGDPALYLGEAQLAVCLNLRFAASLIPR